MFKKTGVAVALVAMLAMSALLMSCGSGSNRPSGLLYVVSQSLDNNISSYALDLASGDLSLITNNLASTCPTNGTCGLPTSITVDPTGATAFVLNQAFISGFTVNSDGSLSIDQNGGAAIPVGQSALAMAPTAAGDFLFVISSPPNPSLANAPMISVYGTSPGSTSATLVSSVSLARVPTGVSTVTFTPTGGSAQTMVFVSSNLDLTPTHNDSQLSVFVADSSGNLSEQSASPYNAQAPNPLSVFAVNTNPAGQPAAGGIFVYVGSQAAVAGSVSGFEVCTQVDANCTQPDVDNENLAIAVKPTNVGQNPIAMITDPTNTFLYIACNVGNNVYAFRMGTQTGALTPLAPALEPTGAGPVALAIHPSNNNSNEFLYVANNTASTIVGYTVNLTSGDLSNPMAPVIFTPGNPYGVAGR